MLKRIALIALIFIGWTSSFAQPVKKDTIPHSVRKATILSLCLPGSGQIYNHTAMPKGKRKAFWKVPLIYAGLGVTGYYLLDNNQLKNSLRTEYNNRINLTGNYNPDWSLYDNQGILTLYSLHQQRRDQFLLGFGLVYLIQVADAAVEAHFVNFDISEDLSFQARPTVMYGMQPGISFSFKFK